MNTHGSKGKWEGEASMKTTILVADDHAMIREGLHILFESQDDMTVLGEASSGKEAVDLAMELQPDIVIMGAGLNDPACMEAISQILASPLDTKIIVISLDSTRRFVERMLKAGAAGYLVKESSFDELRRAVQTVNQGQNYLTPVIARTVIDGYLNMSGNGGTPPNSLTNRERQVLRFIGEGVRTKEIAERLDLSVKTIETYRRRVMEKLDLYSIAELIKYAIREGFTSL